MSGRGVERLAFVAAAAEEEPDQNEREEYRDREEKTDHGMGSITAAVP